MRVSSSTVLYRFDESMKLFSRAARVIPGGIYGHESPALSIPGSFPYYAACAWGCRYADVDGNQFIDYLCGYGPIILGYNNAAVDAAAASQRLQANTTNHPAPVMVELAEHLVSTIPVADWVFFGKNGGDMTTYATLVARTHTNRKKIVMVRGHYHGVAPWFTSLGCGGTTPEDHLNVLHVEWNDLTAFQALARRHRGEIAAFIAMPYHHIAFGEQVMPAPGYWQGIEQTCRQEGIVLILDDVRAGFRLQMGGSNEYFGFEPDLICLGTAMGNGYPISACAGKKELMAAAGRVFSTGSFWFSAVPMAASLATLKELENKNAVAKIEHAGGLLTKGLESIAARYGLEVKLSGPPALPYMTFTRDPHLFAMQKFCAEMARRGSLLHPHHNWFISAAHEESDIETTLSHAEDAFRVVKEKFWFHD